MESLDILIILMILVFYGTKCHGFAQYKLYCSNKQFWVKHMIAYPYVLPKSLDSIVKALALPAIASTQFKYYSMAYEEAYTF